MDIYVKTDEVLVNDKQYLVKFSIPQGIIVTEVLIFKDGYFTDYDPDWGYLKVPGELISYEEMTEAKR